MALEGAGEWLQILKTNFKYPMFSFILSIFAILDCNKIFFYLQTHIKYQSKILKLGDENKLSVSLGFC